MQFKEFITFLGTKDLNKTSNFYQNILGLTIYKDQNVCLIFNINNQSKIGFCEHMSVIYDDKSPIITFVTEEVDKQEYILKRIRKSIPGLIFIIFSLKILMDIQLKFKGF